MKTSLKLILLLPVAAALLLCNCSKKDENTDDPGPQLQNGSVIADYTVATDAALRSIPKKYIDKARTTLHIAYQHTSHGTHVSYGMFGLPGFKAGDETLFAITNNTASPVTDKLDFHDYALASYAAAGKDASDLSRDETAFIQATRNYLDDPKNAGINVVMWSWCSIMNHSVATNYLPGMQTLINEYGVNGTKISSGAGKRATPVTFIFMTGHAEQTNVGEGKPANQAELITNFCRENKQLCLDYYSIDSHCMQNKYWDDVTDDALSTKYGGNFHIDWQNSHSKGTHWYENREQPGGAVTFGQHNTQHITANRKAFAMWWILARIAGWDGVSSN